MRLAFLLALGLSSGAAVAQQIPPGDPTPPPIDRSVPNSGTSRTTDDAARPTERDGSLVNGGSGSSTPVPEPGGSAPLHPNSAKSPPTINGNESTRMPAKIEPGDARPDR